MAKPRMDLSASLAILKVRPGTYFPSFAAAPPPCRGRAAGGRAGSLGARVSTRKVDDLVKALGVDGISKSEVSRICGGLNRSSRRFGRGRSPASVRISGWTPRTTRCGSMARVMSQATGVAVGITSEGDRQVLDIDVGPSDAIELQAARALTATGLLSAPDPGVDLAIEPPCALEAAGDDGAGARHFFLVQEVRLPHVNAIQPCA